MCCLFRKSTGTSNCFCGCMGRICGKYKFKLWIRLFRFNLIDSILFTASFTSVNHNESRYGDCMDEGNQLKVWCVVKHAVRWKGNGLRWNIRFQKVWIKEYPFVRRSAHEIGSRPCTTIVMGRHRYKGQMKRLLSHMHPISDTSRFRYPCVKINFYLFLQNWAHLDLKAQARLQRWPKE